MKRLTEDYSKEEILKAIDNYVTVVNDKNYLFDYKWNLETFLQKSNALPDFMDDGSKWRSYLDTVLPKHRNDRKFMTRNYSSKEELELDGELLVIKSTDIYKTMMDILKKMPYSEYLQTEHWLHFKSEALKNAQHRCKLCNTNDDTLHVHHNNYDNRGRETFNDVIVLCGDCHAKFHGK